MLKKKKNTAHEVIFYQFKSKELTAEKIFVLNLYYIVIIFCLQVQKGVADSKKTKRLSKEEIKKQMLESFIINEVAESEKLNKQGEEIQEPEEAAKVIKQYEDIIKMKKKGMISIAYYQRKIFKRFKE